MNSQLVRDLLQDQDFLKGIMQSLGMINKASTIDQSVNLLWYDLRPVVQLLFPFKELIPRISQLPRVPADGGNAYHWKRITAINVNQLAIGVSEGNRGPVIAINVQDQNASYKTLGLEGNVTFEARLGGINLSPDTLGTAIQSTLRSTMIGEEQTLILGNASLALGTTPTPTLTASGSGSSFTVGTVYVVCVALSGFGWLTGSVANGVKGSVSRTNADSTTDTFGGGSAAPSAEASIAVTAGQNVTATVTAVSGAVAYAWYVSQATGTERIASITQGNQIKLTKAPATGQLSSALSGDNSQNTLLPDGILAQIFGSVFGSAPSTAMQTNPSLPAVVTSGDTLALSSGGSLVYTMKSGNAGLTISGTNISEFDVVLQAAYDQYKIGFDRILMSSTDIAQFLGVMFAQNAAAQYRIFFDADEETGRIIAGRKITSYMNKFMGNTLDIEIHPFIPPGTIVLWSDRTPYELSGVPNILEAHVRQDYYQIQWPFRTRKYEYGVYTDEVFSCYFTPAFAVITNLNGTAGTPSA